MSNSIMKEWPKKLIVLNVIIVELIK